MVWWPNIAGAKRQKLSKLVSDQGDKDAPLIGTLRFVFVMGATFAVLWLGMLLLLRDRW